MPFRDMRRGVQLNNDPVGVVDIGSNSIRLIVYESLSRSPVPVFNEKAMCGIGRGLVDTGELNQKGMEGALDALGRFRVILDSVEGVRVFAVATAAVRDAKQGNVFVQQASAQLGQPIRVLSGEEEAILAAEGVLSAIPAANGVVGDLGGGSLELCEVSEGKIGRGITVPLGPLRLMDESKGNIEKAQEIARDAFSKVTWLSEHKGSTFYAVGGTWRSLARINMAQEEYPLHILHHYAIQKAQAKALSGVLSHLSRKTMERIDGLSKRRIDSLPFGAVVLDELIGTTNAREVVVSAFGLREGLLFNLLPVSRRNDDPLVDGCRAYSERLSRNPAINAHLGDWLSDLFPKDPPERARLRKAAALLSDIGWRGHPDYRGIHSYYEVLRMPLTGLDHRERTMIARAVMVRYTGDQDVQLREVKDLLDADDHQWARRLGVALRFAHTMCGGVSDLLEQANITRTDEGVVVSLSQEANQLMLGDTARKRFTALGRVFGEETSVQVVELQALQRTGSRKQAP